MMMHDSENQPIADETPNTEAKPQEAENVQIDTDTAAENVADDIAGIAAQVTEFKDKYLRLYADFENFRKRTAKEKTDLIRNAGEDLIKSLLPVLDDFERAQKSVRELGGDNSDSPKVQALSEGVELIYRNLFNLLSQRGLKKMDSAIGKPLNVDEHESITQFPAPSEELRGKVIDEVACGYYLHDKVIRFARVVVGS